MATLELKLKADFGEFNNAVERFAELYNLHPNDGFGEEFIALQDGGRLFVVVQNSDVWMLLPSNEFKFLLEEMAL